jgi:hypothetical protein
MRITIAHDYLSPAQLLGTLHNINSKALTILVTVMGWYRTKRPLQVRPFYDLSCALSEFQ